MATITFLATGVSKNWSDPTAWDLGRVPTLNDDVVFSTNVASSTLVINGTLAAPSQCKSITTTGYTRSITQSGTAVLQIAGSMTFSTGLTYAPATGSIIHFVGTSTGNTITFAGYQGTNLTFNGVGGGWTFQDAFNASGSQGVTITLTNGALDTNGQNVGTATGRVDLTSSNSNTRSLTLGTTTWIMGVSTPSWDITNSTGMTLSASSSTLKTTLATPTLNGGGLSYGTLTNNTISVVTGVTINGSNTFTNLNFSFAAATQCHLYLGANQTITGTLTLAGNSGSALYRLGIESTVKGTQRTITTSSTPVLSYVDFRDIIGAGTGWNLASITGNSGDAGNNSGITFTTAATIYAVTAASSVFSATGLWFTTSGGATSARVPLPQDTARFDANSISGASRIITLDLPRLPSINWTGVTNSPTMNSSAQTGFCGDLTMASSVSIIGAGTFSFEGRGSRTITSAGVTFGSNRNVVVDCGNGTYTQQDDFSTGTLLETNTFIGTSGTWLTNGYNLTLSRMTWNGGIFTAGTGSTVTVLTATQASGWFTGGTFTCLAGTFSKTAGTVLNMAGGAVSLNMSCSGIAVTNSSTGNVTLTGTCAALTLSGVAGTTQTIGGVTCTTYNQTAGNVTMNGMLTCSSTFTYSTTPVTTMFTNNYAISCTSMSIGGAGATPDFGASAVTLTAGLIISNNAGLAGSAVFSGGTTLSLSSAINNTYIGGGTFSGNATLGSLSFTTGSTLFQCAGLTLSVGTLNIGSGGMTCTTYSQTTGTVFNLAAGAAVTGSSTFAIGGGTFDASGTNCLVTGFTTMALSTSNAFTVYSAYQTSCSSTFGWNSSSSFGNVTLGAGGLTCSFFNMVTSGTGSRTMNMGSGTITLTGTGTIGYFTGTNIIWNMGTCTFRVTDTSASTKTFTYPSGFSFYSLRISNTTSGSFTLPSSCTITGTLTIDAGGYLLLTAGQTFTVATLVSSGSGSGYAYMYSTTASVFNLSVGTTFTTYTWDWLAFTACNLVPQLGSSYYVGANAYNGGTNSGMSFSAGPNTLTAVGGNWNTPATWSPALWPQSADTIILDVTATSNVTMDGTAGQPNRFKSLTCTGFVRTLAMGSATVWAGAPSAGNVLLVSGMTVTNAGSSWTFCHTTGSNTITWAGKLVPTNITFNGLGGSWQLQDALTTMIGGANCTLTLTAGSLDTNGQNIGTTSVGMSFVTNGSLTRSLTLGATTWIFNGAVATATGWQVVSSVGLTLSAGTSTLQGQISSNSVVNFFGGGMTYANVILLGNLVGQALVTGSNTFGNLTFTQSSARCDLSFAANQTITGTLTVNGITNAVALRGSVISSMTGSARTITAATVVQSWMNWMDITAAGAANWDLSASTGYAGDRGGNTGITFTSSQNCYLVMGANSNWSGNVWFTTSGGLIPSRWPLPQDDVFMDANSFTASGITLTIDTPLLGRNLTMTGAGSNGWAVQPTITTSASFPWTIFGNVTLTSGVTYTTLSGSLIWGGRGNQTVTMNGGAWPSTQLNILAPGGTYTLQDNFTGSSGALVPAISAGTLALNGFTFAWSTVTIGNAAYVAAATLKLGANYSGAAGNISIASNGNFDMNGYNFATTNGAFVVTGGTMTMSGNFTCSSTASISGGVITGSSGKTLTSNLSNISGGTHTFDILNCAGALTITGTADVTCTGSAAFSSMPALAGTSVFRTDGADVSTPTTITVAAPGGGGGSGPVSYGYAG